MMAFHTREASPKLVWLRREESSKEGVTVGETVVRCVVRGGTGAPDSVWGSDSADPAASCSAR
jgi:hypothetical protein